MPCFVVCNGFPLIAMRLNDVRKGTATIGDVPKRYLAAWETKRMDDPATGLVTEMSLSKQDFTIPAKDPANTAWASAFMNIWHSSFVRNLYNRKAFGYVTTINGKTVFHPHLAGNAYHARPSPRKSKSSRASLADLSNAPKAKQRPNTLRKRAKHLPPNP